MILDLNYGGAVVRSLSCKAFWCGDGLTYSHEASSTWHDEHESFSLHLPPRYIYGNISSDNMHLVSLNITNVTFGEVNELGHRDNYLLWVEAYSADGYVRRLHC